MSVPGSGEAAGRETIRARVLKGAIPLLVLAAVIVIFFNRLALSNLILARGDILLYFYPYWHQAAEAFRAGRVPQWNPDLFMGAPFLANSQVGFFYPLNWPLWLMLPTPYAVSASILLHIMIAGVGTYAAGRKCLSLNRPAALIAALLFSLGGYVTAQVEHINQLQGMAWLPWYLVALCTWKPEPGDWLTTGKLTATLAALFSLQFLAGHTQTVLITIAGIAVWLVVQAFFAVDEKEAATEKGRHRITGGLARLAYTLIPLVAGGILALILVSIQLLPTLELAQHSSRQGGLPANEVLSFSLNPLLLTRSLLPAYDQPLFSEYVAVLPLTGLLLAIIGIWSWRGRPGAGPLVVMAALGLFLALGVFNPVYHLLARLPLFNLFRAPARWMLLYALGIALLAGLGWDILFGGRQASGRTANGEFSRIPLKIGILFLLGLMLWGVFVIPLSSYVPLGAENTVAAPSALTWIGWAVELIALLTLLFYSSRVAVPSKFRPALLAVVTLVALFAATRLLPYNAPTTPEAVLDVRPPIARLQAMTGCGGDGSDCGEPGGRYLSLSEIFFDLGDQAEIDTIYSDQISAGASYDYTVAAKQKEILGPNLSMMFGLAAVDGFDGGLLPLRNYSDLTSLIMPGETRTTDGRLREHLPAVPEAQWLDLFNARYLITDKVGDEWRQGVFFDQQHAISMIAGNPAISVGFVPAYEATELWLVADGEPGAVEVTTKKGQVWRMNPEPIEADLYHVVWPEPTILQAISIFPCYITEPDAEPCQSAWQLKGLALVDSRDETFQPLVPGEYRLVHSGDVKIYENLDALPRAFLVYDWRFLPEIDDALEAMSAAGFDPAKQAVIVDPGQDGRLQTGGAGEATITEYEPDRVVVEIDGDADGLLLLSDAYYPGWQAKLDGDPVSIYQTDILFRGLMVPSGEHEVEFIFEPASYRAGRLISLVGLGFLIVLIAVLAIAPRLRCFTVPNSRKCG